MLEMLLERIELIELLVLFELRDKHDLVFLLEINLVCDQQRVSYFKVLE